MKNRIYKRGVFLLLCFSFCRERCAAQDTTKLAEVVATVRMITLAESGKRTDSPDQLARQNYISASVADLLNTNSTIFIKNYGPGALATSALRGGNASQTAVLWNGLNIQNSMLGQTDLSMLPASLFDGLSVEYGGSSALWGSGAVGGSIQLFNQLRFNEGMRTRVSLNGGSFGSFNASTRFDYSSKKFSSSTKAYLRNSNNNYIYYDTLNTEKPRQELKHAAYSFKGLMQDLRYALNQYQSISMSLWYNQAYRQIPSFNPAKNDKAFQVDKNIRGSLSWDRNRENWKNSIKTAWFKDQINYNDSITRTFSNGVAESMIFENDNILRWGHFNSLNFGLNSTIYKAQSDNYDGTRQLKKISVLAGNKFYFLDYKLMLYPVVRAEYFSAGALPVTYNLAVDYRPLKRISAKISGAKVYRQPSLNELYWVPGGNPNLKAEQGYSIDGDLSYSITVKKFFFSVAGSAFHRVIDNWILWLPGTGNSPTPVNLQQVWSRGTETRSKIEYRTEDVRVSLQVFSSYVLSTIQSSSQENGNTVGRQLIYTPRYSGNGIFTIALENISLSYYHQYVGYRFTSSDNSQWLPPYQVSSLKLNLLSKAITDTEMTLFVGCNNIFNSKYAVVAGRYMPLRTYEFGITLKNQREIKTKTETKTSE